MPCKGVCERYRSTKTYGGPVYRPDGVDVDHFDQCVKVLLENRDDDSFWND